MKSSNLARRIEPAEEPLEPAQAPLAPAPDAELPAVPPARPRLRLARRAIVIRDQGFAQFRVR
jgi:hypothetical protein